MNNTKKMKKNLLKLTSSLLLIHGLSKHNFRGKKTKICVSVITDNPRGGFLLLDTLNFQEHSCNKEAPDHCARNLL